MNPEDSLYAELFDRSHEIENRIASDQQLRPLKLQAGDLFLLKMPMPVPVSWCAVFAHSQDDSLWYCVPGDSLSLIANTDVPACASGFHTELNFRCHCGLWVHAEDVVLSNRFARLEQSDVVSIRDKVAEIAASPITALDSDVSHDPDYEEWIEELRYAVDSLLHSLHDEPTVSVRLIGPESAIEAYEEVLSLAADDSIEPTDSEVPNLLETRQVSNSIDGRLQVSLFDDGVIMEWLPKKMESPLPVVLHGETSLEWFPQKDFYCTNVVPWDGQAVELTLDDEVISVPKPGVL